MNKQTFLDNLSANAGELWGVCVLVVLVGLMSFLIWSAFFSPMWRELEDSENVSVRSDRKRNKWPWA